MMFESFIRPKRRPRRVEAMFASISPGASVVCILGPSQAASVPASVDRASATLQAAPVRQRPRHRLVQLFGSEPRLKTLKSWSANAGKLGRTPSSHRGGSNAAATVASGRSVDPSQMARP